MTSGLYRALTEKRLLIPHRETDGPGIGEQAFLVLEPERVPLISYPYEWCFGQLRDAALTTLHIQRIALDYGMTLKDASAYNIQFVRGKALLIDTLSFDFYRDGDPWVAYGQFCRHFLAPLFLMVHADIRLGQLLRAYIDGIPLDLASKLLRGKGGFAAKQHIHWHAKSVLAHGQDGQDKQDGPSGQKTTKQPKISKFQLTALIDSMSGIVQKLALKGVQSEWGDYYARTNYSGAAAESKKQLTADFLSKISPAVTWDFGANDGVYSRLALDGGDGFVAAFDSDPVAVERNYTAVKRSGENMLPLLLDLTNPSPAAGFAGRERGALESRQKPDCILMLAVIHHLAISNNLPLGMIAEWLATLCRFLIIEFVPKSDSQVKVLLATRDDIFPAYSVEGFEASFAPYFDVTEKHPVADSERVLYLMNTKG